MTEVPLKAGWGRLAPAGNQKLIQEPGELAVKGGRQEVLKSLVCEAMRVRTPNAR